jgi:hypothetical protein
MKNDNPFGEGDLSLRILLGTLQLFVFGLALLLLALVSYG